MLHRTEIGTDSVWRQRGSSPVWLKGMLYPLEIKLTATPSVHHLAPVEKLRKLMAQEDVGQGPLICRVDEPVAMPSGNLALPWLQFPRWIRERLS